MSGKRHSRAVPSSLAERAIYPGAQTERRGEAGPVSLLLGGGRSPAALLLELGSPKVKPTTPARRPSEGRGRVGEPSAWRRTLTGRYVLSV